MSSHTYYYSMKSPAWRLLNCRIARDCLPATSDGPVFPWWPWLLVGIGYNVAHDSGWGIKSNKIVNQNGPHTCTLMSILHSTLYAGIYLGLPAFFFHTSDYKWTSVIWICMANFVVLHLGTAHSCLGCKLRHFAVTLVVHYAILWANPHANICSVAAKIMSRIAPTQFS